MFDLETFSEFRNLCANSQGCHALARNIYLINYILENRLLENDHYTFKDIHLHNESLPKQAEIFSLRGCGEVIVETNTFSNSVNLKSITLQDLNVLRLLKTFFRRKKEKFSDLIDFTVSDVSKLYLAPFSFKNFPKCRNVLFEKNGIPTIPHKSFNVSTDVFTLSRNTIGRMHKGSIYSDASEVIIKRNRIELMESESVDLSVRKFEFVGNTVDMTHNNAFTTLCTDGKIINNTFENQIGSPFGDVEVESSCTADPEGDYEEGDIIVYNVVANPTLSFSGNYFLNYTQELLNFQGVNKVPLGSLEIKSNILDCKCSSLKTLAKLTDYSYLFESSTEKYNKGSLLFKKIFYDTGFCQDREKNVKVPIRKYLSRRLIPSTLIEGQKMSLICVEITDEDIVDVRKQLESNPNSQKWTKTSSAISRQSSSVLITILFVNFSFYFNSL